MSQPPAAPDPAPPIRVVLADGDPLIIDGLESVLAAQPAIQVVGTTESPARLAELIGLLTPDVVVVDRQLLTVAASRISRGVTRLGESTGWPPTAILVLGDHAAESEVRWAFGHAAAGFILKASAAEQLHAAISSVAGGRMWVDPVVLERAGRPGDEPPEPPAPGDTARLLTVQERQLLRLLAEGFSNRQIARTLWVSESTVAVLTERLFTKLRVRNRWETEGAYPSEAAGGAPSMDPSSGPPPGPPFPTEP
jgi:DNA-binding NarL/FixJ family response regulator